MPVRAAIDIGSNSIKLLVLNITSPTHYEILLDRVEVTGLGTGVSDTGMLADGPVRETVEVISAFNRTALELGAESVRVAATSAVRDAANRHVLLELVKDRTGLEIEVLTGAEEARLSREVAIREVPAVTGAGDTLIFFDVGGGSTELTVYRGSDLVKSASLQLGARRLADQANATQPLTDEMEAEMLSIVRGQLAESAPQPDAKGAIRLAGLGGTASSVVWIVRGLAGLPKGDPHLAVVTSGQLGELLEKIHVLPLEHVKELPNLSEKRAGIIYAGIMIIDELLSHYGVSEFVLIDRGLRFGLLLA